MALGEQREPFYIAQTFEEKHLVDPKKWFSDRAAEAISRGGVRSRRSYDKEKGGLLIEYWDGHLPPDKGDIRWAFAATT